MIKFWEKGNVNERRLQSFEKMLYTWQDPAGDRVILWDESDETVENDLRRDGIKPIKDKNGDIQSYWVSFLDGTQRVLLFTNVHNIAFEANSANRLDKVRISLVIIILLIISSAYELQIFRLRLWIYVIIHEFQLSR